MLASVDMHGRPAQTPVGQEMLEAAVFAAMITQAAGETFGEALRLQLASKTLIKRELSGCGFFLEFSVPDDVPAITNADNPLPSDVHARLGTDETWAGFIVFTTGSGRAELLEGFTFGNDLWPDDVSTFKLTNSLEEPILQ